MREVYELATRGMRHPSVDELVIANLDAMVGYMKDAIDGDKSTFIHAHARKDGDRSDHHRLVEFKAALAISFQLMRDLGATPAEALGALGQPLDLLLSFMTAHTKAPVPSDAVIRNRASQLRQRIPIRMRHEAIWALRQSTGDTAAERLPPSGQNRADAIAAVAMVS